MVHLSFFVRYPFTTQEQVRKGYALRHHAKNIILFTPSSPTCQSCNFCSIDKHYCLLLGQVYMTPNWLCSSIVTCWPYRRIGIGWFGELCPRYIGTPLTFSLCIYGFDINHHIGFLGLSRGQLLKLKSTHATFNDYSCPLIDTGGITLWLYCSVKSQYIGPQGRSGRTIRGFPGHLTDSRRQLLEINIEIRFIVLVYSSV